MTHVRLSLLRVWWCVTCGGSRCVALGCLCGAIALHTRRVVAAACIVFGPTWWRVAGSWWWIRACILCGVCAVCLQSLHAFHHFLKHMHDLIIARARGPGRWCRCRCMHLRRCRRCRSNNTSVTYATKLTCPACTDLIAEQNKKEATNPRTKSLLKKCGSPLGNQNKQKNGPHSRYTFWILWHVSMNSISLQPRLMILWST